MRKKNGELICVMANQVAEARHKLTVMEQRLVLWLIAQIKPTDRDFLTHTLAVRDFERVAGATSGRLYEQMKTVSKGLLRSILEVREPGLRSGVCFQWFSRVQYNDGEGTLMVRFHDELRPLLLELKARFTQLALSQALKLRSGYSIRFYELLASRQALKRFEMTVGELREWAGLDAGEMPRTVDLRRFVLDVAQRELNAKADLSFDVEPVRSGRAVVSFVFRVRKIRLKKASSCPVVPLEPPPEGEDTRHSQKTALAALRKNLASAR